MIISIRGTSGSGKSTLVRKLMDTSSYPPEIFEDDQVVGHCCRKFLLVGPYPRDAKLAAGVDILNRTRRRRRRRDQLFDQIGRWAKLGSVVYEGLLVSNEVGRTVELAAQFSTKVVFLDTSLELCLARVNQRRKQKAGISLFGEADFKPVNPKKTVEKFEELRRVADRLIAAKVVTCWLSWDDALVYCQELLR